MRKNRRNDFASIRRRVGLTVGVAMPLFLLFASVGEVERGLVATFLAYIALSAFQLGWGRRRQIWFWSLGAAMVLAGIVQVFAIDWPHLDTGSGLLTGYAAASVYGLVWFGLFVTARRLTYEPPEEAPIRCRVCKLPVCKGEVRCSHCGEWAPGPVPRRPVLVALVPLAFVVVAIAVIRIGAFLSPPPAEYVLPPGAEIKTAYERTAARKMLKDRRVACERMRSLTSGGIVQDSKLWIAECDGPGERYAIYPATGFVKSCGGTAACE